MSDLWSIFGAYLYFAHTAYNVRVHSFVLMPNHFHLIARFPEHNRSEAMGYFMGETSRRISAQGGRINQIYGGRYHRTLISDERYYRHVYKYVYRNPVKAGLSSCVEEYPFSTFNWLVGKSQALFPLEEDTLLFSPNFNDKVLSWLNTSPDGQSIEEVRLALRRKIFELPRDGRTKLISRLEQEEF